MIQSDEPEANKKVRIRRIEEERQKSYISKIKASQVPLDPDNNPEIPNKAKIEYYKLLNQKLTQAKSEIYNIQKVATLLRQIAVGALDQLEAEMQLKVEKIKWQHEYKIRKTQQKMFIVNKVISAATTVVSIASAGVGTALAMAAGLGATFYEIEKTKGIAKALKDSLELFFKTSALPGQMQFYKNLLASCDMKLDELKDLKSIINSKIKLNNIKIRKFSGQNIKAIPKVVTVGIPIALVLAYFV